MILHGTQDLIVIIFSTEYTLLVVRDVLLCLFVFYTGYHLCFSASAATAPHGLLMYVIEFREKKQCLQNHLFHIIAVLL